MWIENGCHWKCLSFEKFSSCPAVLEPNVDTTLNLQYNREFRLYPPYIILSALDLKNPLQTLPWASNAAAHKQWCWGPLISCQRGNNWVILHQHKYNWYGHGTGIHKLPNQRFWRKRGMDSETKALKSVQVHQLTASSHGGKCYNTDSLYS